MEDPGEDITRVLEPSKLEALVEAMYLAAYADGEFSDVERGRFARSIDRLTDGRISPARFEDLMLAFENRLADGGREACIGSVRERLSDPELRWLAVLLAADITAADGIIRASERDVLLELAAALDVDEQEAAQLVQGFEVG